MTRATTTAAMAAWTLKQIQLGRGVLDHMLRNSDVLVRVQPSGTTRSRVRAQPTTTSRMNIFMWERLNIQHSCARTRARVYVCEHGRRGNFTNVTRFVTCIFACGNIPTLSWFLSAFARERVPPVGGFSAAEPPLPPWLMCFRRLNVRAVKRRSEF